MNTFLDLDILKYFPLNKIEEQNPLFGELVPVNKGSELKSFWGVEGDPQYRIRNIHQWLADPCQDRLLTYFPVRENVRFYHLMGYLSDDPLLKYSTNLLVMHPSLLAEFSRELAEWGYRIRSGELGVPSFIRKVINKEVLVEMSPYCNKDEVLVLDTFQFEILIGMTKRILKWNLVCFRPGNNKKIIYQTREG